MPDENELYEVLEDLHNDLDHDDDHHHHHPMGGGLFGHGGFFEPNHFEWPGFFVTPSSSKVDPYYTGKIKKWGVRFLAGFAIAMVIVISLVVVFIK